MGPPALKKMTQRTKGNLDVKKKSKEWQESWDREKDVGGEFLRMNNNGNFFLRELTQLSV